MIIWKRFSHLGKMAGVFAGISGAIVGTATAWPFIEPYVLAHRGYVVDRNSAVVARIIKIQLDRNHDRRERLLGEVEKRELELQSDQARQLPQYRELVQQRVDRVKRELKEIEDDDTNLFKEKKR